LGRELFETLGREYRPESREVIVSKMQRGAMGSEPAIPSEASPSFAPSEDRYGGTQWGERSLKARKDRGDARLVRKQAAQDWVRVPRPEAGLRFALQIRG